MEQSLISILTPFKNTAEFLPSCLDSIIKQSYSNWELIIVDDASTDTSFEIVSMYSERDNRIKLLRNSGSGIIDALRCAFLLSNGDYITRMDSDDIMTPDKLETLSNHLNDYGKGHIAIGQVNYFSKNGISEGYAKYEHWLNRLTALGNNYSEIYKECVIPSPCWMVHRDDLIASGAFDSDRYPEDYDLTFRFYEHDLKCIPCQDMIHYWRDYDNRTSRIHEHYAQNYFLNIKLHYFIKLDYNSDRPLAIWGAGSKGKTISKMLVKKGIPFFWICDNPKKIGRNIYGQILRPFEFLSTLKNPQSIITVANDSAQKEIRNYLDLHQMIAMKDYFFFC